MYVFGVHLFIKIIFCRAFILMFFLIRIFNFLHTLTRAQFLHGLYKNIFKNVKNTVKQFYLNFIYLSQITKFQ